MKKEELLSKLETLVGGMREELGKNEGSTLQTISASMKSGYEGVKSAISGNDKAQKFLDSMKNNFGELSKTVKAGDRKLSAKTLDALEKLIREYKEKNAGKKESKESTGEPKAENASPPMLESQSLDPATLPQKVDDDKTGKE